MSRKSTLIGRYPVKPAGRKSIYDGEKLKNLIEYGLKDQDIADEIGCSNQLVAHVRRKRGMFYRFGSGGIPKLDYSKMNELYFLGKNDCEISAELKCSQSSVNYWRNCHGLHVIGRHKKSKLV